MTPLFHAARRCLVSAAAVLVLVSIAGAEQTTGPAKQFRAGAFAVDITPDWFPVVVNGGFQPQYAKKAYDPLHARCLVLDDGRTRIAIVVVDSCVMDRPIHDEAKQLAEKRTGIPAGRIFISTTHCHSAPAAVGALGTEPDSRYRRFLPGKIAEGIEAAQKNLAPAQVGWAVGSLPGVPQSRRWISRPDTIKEDPFGQKTTRATMHPGYRNPDWEEPSGPMNPDVPVVAVRRPGGRPIAVLSNFAIHYVGAPALSADYFGVFARRIGELIGAGETCPPFVGMLSNGVSGDAYLNDYSRKEPDRFNVNSIAEIVAQEAAAAYRKIQWNDWLPLAVEESDLELAVRQPKVEWAKAIMAQIEKEGRPLKSLTDFYAREQLLLAQMPPTRRLKLEAVRIGTLAMVGIPCEVFAITGLRINASSPFDYTFTVMLANGWDGYLPPPEQMAMGGYTTWLARSSCLEPQAEPKIRARVGKLLDQAAGGYRAKKPKAPPSAYAAAVLASRPAAYWRLGDLEGPQALEAVSGKGLGQFETQVAYYMPGPQLPAFPGLEAGNHAPHFVGQRLTARVPGLGQSYTVELWFYNCMPTDAREVTGCLFSRGPADGSASAGEHLAIGGKGAAAGRLIFHAGADPGKAQAGTSNVPLRNWVPRESWHHVAMVRDGSSVKVYLDGQAQPEIAANAAAPPATEEVFIAGRNDGRFNFEGRIDEVAVYLRAVPAEEVQKHYRAAAAAAGGWVALFDGKRLDGWEQLNGKAKYEAKDGAIVGTSAPDSPNSFLCTKRHYGDFELEFDVKVDPRLNSGVQIRSHSSKDYDNGRVHGYQVEIAVGGFSGGIYDESRRNKFLNADTPAPGILALLKKDAWNHYRVVCEGDRIQTWVNGVKVTDLRDDMTRSGFIGLQVHGVGKLADPLEVRWRNLRLRELAAPETPR